MANHRDRVRMALTPIVGTTQLFSLSSLAAAPGFRTFSSAYSGTGQFIVTYVIEDGNAWEAGEGIFNASDNSFNRNVVTASSSAGNKINVSSTSATLSVEILSQDSVADWPYLVLRRQVNNETRSGGFNQLTFGPAVNDSHNGWDGNMYYTVPQTGLYDILLKYRMSDYSSQNGQGYGMGVDTGLNDSPDFAWFEGGGALRKGAIYRRISFFNKNERLLAFDYVDGTVTIAAIALTILRVR